MPRRLYDSEKWLYKKYIMDKMEIAQIAAVCECNEITIYRKLHALGLIKKR